MADNLAHPYKRRKSLASSPNDCWLIRRDVGRVLTIDDLPDDVLLEIFAFYVVRLHNVGFHHLYDPRVKKIEKIESWQSLVHVCRRWRCLVFGSPRHLNLHLCYAPSRSAMKTPDVWPADLPLIIQGDVSDDSVDNVIAH